METNLSLKMEKINNNSIKNNSHKNSKQSQYATLDKGQHIEDIHLSLNKMLYFLLLNHQMSSLLFNLIEMIVTNSKR